MNNIGNKSIHSISFNQLNSCFTAAMDTGFRIYNVEPLAELQHGLFEDFGSIRIAEMYHRSNIIALVGGGSQSKFSSKMLRIWDDSNKEFVYELSFDSIIRAVRMKRDRLIVVLTHKIYVFSSPVQPEHLQTIETRENIRGLCQVAPSSTCNTMVFPGREHSIFLIS